MHDYSKELNEQLKEIDSLILATEKRIRKGANLPQGRMFVKGCHGYPQYYFQDGQTHEKTYLKSSEKRLITQLAQFDYDKKALNLLNKLKAQLDHFLSVYDINSIHDQYDKLCPGRRQLVMPILPSDDTYVKQWLESHPGLQNPFPQEGVYLTDRGEMVRSKSEKILADLFNSMSIPYQYEPMLELKNHMFVCPDFVLLNIETKRTYYWEHLGLMDDMEYAQKAYAKLENYETNGLYLGKDLIISMETAEHPLNVKAVKEKISRYFC